MAQVEGQARFSTLPGNKPTLQSVNLTPSFWGWLTKGCDPYTTLPTSSFSHELLGSFMLLAPGKPTYPSLCNFITLHFPVFCESWVNLQQASLDLLLTFIRLPLSPMITLVSLIWATETLFPQDQSDILFYSCWFRLALWTESNLLPMAWASLEVTPMTP